MAGGSLFGFPFYAIIKGTHTEPAPLSNLVLSFGGIFLVLIAIVVMIRDERFRDYGRTHPVEILFLFPICGAVTPTTIRIGREVASLDLRSRSCCFVWH